MLGRCPDKGGRWGKIQSLLGGMSEEELRQTMMESKEYKSLHRKRGVKGIAAPHIDLSSRNYTSKFLSIIIRTHKRPKALRRCLDSLNDQYYKNLEIVLISDCNEDNVEEIRHEYLDLSFLIEHVDPLGYPACNTYFNEVKDSVRSEYVMFLDDDDMMVGTMCSKDLEDFAIKNHHPAVIISKVMYPGRAIPQQEYWKKYPVIYHISGSNFCIRSDIYKKHNWPAIRSGDFYFIDGVLKNIDWKSDVCWFDKITARITGTGKGLTEWGNDGKDGSTELLTKKDIPKQLYPAPVVKADEQEPVIQYLPENHNIDPDIKLTVGLPLYRAKNIAWIAFESLCRQQSIDFGWELIVIEETVDKLLPFGKDNVLSYARRLEEAGCKKITYIPISQWVPLSSKWFNIADRASSESICMLLQSADCYSSPGRLKETLKLFEAKNADWVHSRIHVIYNISDEKIVLYDHVKAGHNCGSDMAIRISILKSLHSSARHSGEKIRSGVDGFLYKQCQLIKNKFAVLHDTTDNWKHSINVNGMNNISNRKVLIDRLPDNSDIIKPLIPEDILKRLRKLKTTVKIDISGR